MNPNSVKNFFGIKVSKQGVPVNNASDKQLVYKDDYSTKTYYDTTNSRMVEGKLPDGRYGLWVSKPGFDVTTADASQLIFNSNQDVFKIVTSGTTTIPAQSLVANGEYYDTIIIPHNLSYIPVLLSYALVNYYIAENNTFPVITITNYVSLPYDGAHSTPAAPLGVGAYNINAGVDATNVYFSYWYQATSTDPYNFPDVPIRYYLLQETAT